MSLATVVLLAGGALSAAELTFEERVKAQEAIQRVYYSHQLNTTLPFEEAVPREALEKQVRDYLQKSAALDLFWKTPVTQAALHAELERISRSTRLPDRLQEIYAALDHNPMLIEECFARPALVDRLVHNFFSTDQRLHASERAQAEDLHNRLLSGDLSIDAPESHRTVRDVAEAPTVDGAEAPPAGADHSLPSAATPDTGVSLPHDQFLRWRATLPEHVGAIGPVLDRDEAFVIQVVLSESPDRVKVATYTVPKKSWSSWWEESRTSFYIESVHAVASKSDPLPSSPGSAGKSGSAFSGEPEPDLSTLAPDCLQAYWDNGSLGNLPSPRAYHSAVWTGSVMILWGGSATRGDYPSLTTEYYDTGWRYDPLTDAWSPISTLNAPAARAQHSAVWTGTEMIVWGGTDFHNMFRSGGRYNPATDTWSPTTLSGAPASGLVQNSVVWTGTEMIVWGGKASGGPTRFGGRYVPATDSWLPFTPAPIPIGTGRYDHTAVWTGTDMLVWGGYFSSPFTSPLKYHPATDTWSTYSDTGSPSARSQHGAVWTGSKMIVWGGKNDSTNLTTGGIYDPATDTWSPTSTTNAPTGVHPSAFWTGNRMLTWSGSLAAQYDPVGNAWTSASTVNAPSTRLAFSTVWTGSQMIVWGGQVCTDNYCAHIPFDTGGRYAPATDTWTPTTLSAPEPRQGHAAVWTGTQMIVWGGVDAATNAYPTGGGRYDPLTDSWSPASSTGAPSGRTNHAAVWTGSVLVVWGGSALNVAVNTGGRYDPAADSWSATSTAQAPAARYGATAVWSGSRMIVWGGTDGSAIMNTGARYNPANNTWSATSTTGAPAARAYPGAVWAGSEMIIWGGQTALQAPLDSGGRYNPTSDHWSSMTSLGAPQARSGHSAVWTGSEMLVWGGVGQNTTAGPYLYTGGRYNPQGDAWAPMTTIGAPQSRTSHVTVWTGTEMIVWGGVGTQGAFRTTGGRYNPNTNLWTGITTTGAPRLRAQAAAVWTGSEMIVWGGIYFGPERTGGRLQLSTRPDVDEDQDGTSFCGGDCNDSNPAVHPGATETCNGVDDDCAVAVDDPFDQDNDGFPSCAGDCNDANSSVHPGVTELCNHVDDNCDGFIDDGFQDADGDGWASCLDCNEFNNSIHPNAPEYCNGIDDDCDNLVDDGADAQCDGNPNDCYHGTCTVSGCTSAPWPAATPCSDNNPCTQTDTCNGTSFVCIGSNPVVCVAPDSCHEAGTCSPMSGLCVDQSPKPNGAPCDDGNPCTLSETCAFGVCGDGVLWDNDFDGHPNPACGGNDCNDSNGQVWSSAVEVTNLTLTTPAPADPAWDNQASTVGWETVYDLTSGMLTGSGGLAPDSAVCLYSGIYTSTFDSRPDPTLGAGFWYLARAKNSCGFGTYGAGTDGTPRAIPACP